MTGVAMMRAANPDAPASRTLKGIALADLLRPIRERRRPRIERSYAEQEVRDRIYGWHSGSVERPEPRDSYPHPLVPTRPRGRSG
jgi:hypothetical protein